jgi:Tfp pilus assembly protein PilW
MVGAQHYTRGFSLIEAIVGIAMASMIVVIIGSTTSAISRLYRTAAHTQEALARVQESLEIISSPDLQRHEFVCSQSLGSLAGSTCTRGVQQCMVRDGFTSCWVPATLSTNTNGPLHLSIDGGVWRFADGAETIGQYTRSISIENLCRHPLTGELDVAGCVTESNSKEVTVKVSWNESGRVKEVQLSKHLTAWRNVP